MLDEARKFGLQLVLAHQRPGQLQNSDLAEERDLFSAVMTNARTKVVFGGIYPDELEPIARAISLGVLDPYKIKKEIYSRSVVDYVKEYWTAHGRTSSSSHTSSSSGGSSSATIHSNGSGHSSGMIYDPNSDGLITALPVFTSESQSWQNHFGTSESQSQSWSDSDTYGESHSINISPVLVPQMGTQLSSIYYETLEEQLFQYLAILHDQEQRHAMVRIVGQKEPVPIVVPFVKQISATDVQKNRQLALSYKTTPWFLPVNKAQSVLRERTSEFLAMGKPAESLQNPIQPARIEKSESMPKEEPNNQNIVKIGNVAIQQRDIDLLSDIHESRFTTITHAALLHFGNLKSSAVTAKRRLGKMAEAGLLRKQSIPLDKHKTIFAFTKKAYGLL